MIMIVPIDAHTCESTTLIKCWNIKIIRLDEQTNKPVLKISQIKIICSAKQELYTSAVSLSDIKEVLLLIIF